MKWALESTPRWHRLAVVHGVYAPLTGWSDYKLNEEQKKLKKKYLNMCKEADRECSFLHFPYLTTGHLGDMVCRLGELNNAQSVIVGKRGNVSELRRNLVGSASRAVLGHCRIPVTVVPESRSGQEPPHPRESTVYGEDIEDILPIIAVSE